MNKLGALRRRDSSAFSLRTHRNDVVCDFHLGMLDCRWLILSRLLFRVERPVLHRLGDVTWRLQLFHHLDKALAFTPAWLLSLIVSSVSPLLHMALETFRRRGRRELNIHAQHKIYLTATSRDSSYLS